MNSNFVQIWLRRALAATIASGAFAVVCPVQAAPTTLAFQGVITSIFDPFAAMDLSNPPAFLNVIYSGEPVTGAVTFDPATNQTLSIDVHVNSWNLLATNVTSEIMNNRGVPTVFVNIDQAYVGPVAPDGVELAQYRFYNASSIAPFDDRIYLTNYYVGVAQPPLLIPGFSDLQWQPSLRLIGDQNLLPGEQLPADVATWNAFADKQLLLGFKTTRSLAALRATVTIGGFTAVAEPASGRLVAAFCVVAAIVRPTRNPKSKI